MKEYNNRIIFNCDKAINNEIQLIPIADVHLGNELFDEGYFNAVVDYIEQTDNCYFVLNGDLVENTIKNSPASIFNDTLDPLSQISLVVSKLAKIVAQGKCINITTGNHEMRSSKEVGLNPMDMIVMQLTQYDNTIADRYYPSGVFTFLNVPYRPPRENNFRYATFLMYNQHGKSGGTTLGSAINNSVKEKYSVNGVANIYIRSHTHKAYALPINLLRTDFNNYDIKNEQGWLVSNGAFLNYFGGYGQMAGYEIQDNSTPIIYLKAKRYSFKENKKIKESILKQSNVVMRDKQWFLDQVRGSK